MKDQVIIQDLLRDTLENEQIIDVGAKLGLKRMKLQNIAPEKLESTMISKWLRQDDNVLTTSGPPTIKSLIRALDELGIGVANTIRKKYGIKV